MKPMLLAPRLNLNSKFENQNSHLHDLLTLMLEILDLFDVSIAIAGTAFSLKHDDSIQGNIGEGQDAEYFVDLKFMKNKDIKTYIMLYLNLY